jgi:hypothetical protein
LSSSSLFRGDIPRAHFGPHFRVFFARDASARDIDRGNDRWHRDDTRPRIVSVYRSRLSTGAQGRWPDRADEQASFSTS